MDMNPKTVLVIGGGFSGIVCISHLKVEGLQPVCYEKSNKYGGTWCYRKEAMDGQASIMPTTTINHSKEMGAISNFPPRKEFSNYMRHSECYQYLIEYVKHSDCERYIRYNIEVLHIKKALDYENTGRWIATSKNVVTGEVMTETFDGVLVATGHINKPIIPKFPGQDKFKGRIIHTHSVKEAEVFAGQTVVIVGIGCSAADAAVEISRVAKQVYLSSRSGSFIWNRVGRNGNPIDTMLLRRIFTFLLDILPTRLVSWYLETFYNDVIFDHRFYYSKPKCHVLSKEPSVNDYIGSKLLSGLVIQKCDIVKFTENEVLFEGDDSPIKVDTLIMGTGYTWGFPFLEDGIITKDNDRINLYKCMYPPQLPHSTLAIIAFFLPFGPGFPVAELQIRWACYLLAGKGILPSKDIMMKDIMERYKANLKRYCPGEKISLRIDFVHFCDDLAEQFGVKPHLVKYLFTDFPLFMKLMFGPSLSYQYRLQGHGKWDGARNAIMNVEERIQWPLRKRKAMKKSFFRYILEYLINIGLLNSDVWN